MLYLFPSSMVNARPSRHCSNDSSNFRELFPGASNPSDLSLLEWADKAPKLTPSPHAMEVLVENSGEPFIPDEASQIRSHGGSHHNFLANCNDHVKPSSIHEPLTPEPAVTPRKHRRYCRIMETGAYVNIRRRCGIVETATADEHPAAKHDPHQHHFNSLLDNSSIGEWADQFLEENGSENSTDDAGLGLKLREPVSIPPFACQSIAPISKRTCDVDTSSMRTDTAERGALVWPNPLRSAHDCKPPGSRSSIQCCSDPSGGKHTVGLPWNAFLHARPTISRTRRFRNICSSLRRNMGAVGLREAIEDSHLTRIVYDLAERVYYELGFKDKRYLFRNGHKATIFYSSKDYVETELETCTRDRITRMKTRGETRAASEAIANDIRSIKEHIHRAVLASWRYASTNDPMDATEMDTGLFMATRILWRHNMLCSFNLRPSLKMLTEEYDRHYENTPAKAELNSKILSEIRRGLFELRVQCNVTGEWY